MSAAIDRAAELRLVMHFDKRRQLQIPCTLLKRDQLRLLQPSHNEQDRIGAYRTRFEELVLIDDEVFAEQWKHHGRANGGQMLERSVEKRWFRKNSKWRSATLFVLPGTPTG